MTVDYDSQKDFSEYTSYAFYNDIDSGLDQLEDKRIIAAIDSAFQTRGFVKTEYCRFYVNFYASEYLSESRSTLGIGVGGGGGNVGVGVSGGIPIGGNTVNQRLTIDIIDAELLLLLLQRLMRDQRIPTLPVFADSPMALSVLDALGAAHRHNIVHRDVKPQNVLLDRHGVAQLADFGIALFNEEEFGRSTRAGVAMGSLSFMAPEQRLDARSVGAQADIYATGASLHEATGLPVAIAFDAVIRIFNSRKQICKNIFNRFSF